MPPSPPGPRGRAWAIALGIAAAALVAYLPSLGGGFVFDDHLLLERSPLLRAPLWRLWASADAPDYWPLTSTVFWLEHRVFGADPLGYRLVTLALHGAAAVLLWRVLDRLRVPGAALAGALFAVHPVAVESVAWISETKNTLSGVLFLSAGLAWLRFRGSARTRDAALSTALFAGALLAKTSTVVLPVALVLLAVLERRPLARRERAWLAGQLALAAAFGAVTLWFQWNRSMDAAGLDRGLGERLAHAGLAWATYLWTAFQPLAAAVVYADWPVGATAWGWAALVAGALLLAALWAASGRGTLGAAVALTYHAIAVLPVLGLLDMTFFAFSPAGNHLQYLALMGPAALAGGLLAAARARWRIASTAAAVALLAALGAHARSRAAAYQDDVSLWTRAVSEAPESLTAARMQVSVLAAAGRPAEAVEALRAAEARIRDPASRLRVAAVLHVGGGRPQEAVAAEAAASALREDLVFRLELADTLIKAGHPAAALPLLERLVDRQPRSADVRTLLAGALLGIGRPDLALPQLQAGCGLSQRSDACAALAATLWRTGRGRQARALVAGAMGRRPDDPVVEQVLRDAGVPAAP